MTPARYLAFGALVSTLAGCVATPPQRDPLPPLEEVLPPPVGCTFLVGEPQGVVVEEVIAGGAAEAVLEPGDVILALDGEETLDTASLLLVLGDRDPGEEVGIVFDREGREQSATLVLGENPDDPDRAMIGVLVDTRYEEVLAEEVEGVVPPSATTRPLVVGDTVFLLDPVGAGWQRTDIEVDPDVAWVAASGGLYRLDDGGAIVEMGSGAVVPHDRGGGWDPLRLIGSSGPDLILTVTRPVSGAAETVAVGLSRFDPASTATVWTTPAPEGFGLPLSAMSSPDRSRMVVLGVSQDGSRVTGVDLVDREGAFAGLELVELGTPVGWMDAERVLFRTGADLVTLYSAGDGDTTEVSLDPEVTAVPLYPVGDGEHVLAVSGRTLLRDLLEETGGVRPLAENCLIGRVGEPGWGV